ncbi:MAG: nitroreductase family protein [Thermoleophilia bacterium]|jgi:nitroreductase
MSIILSRRSVRKYTGERVTDDQVTELLKAAMSAPSAGNQQPWHFVVVRSQEVLDRISAVHPYAAMASHASVVIAVCGDPTGLKWADYWVQDCSAATENVLLAAHEMGLGAVWLGVYPIEERVEDIRELLRLPRQVIPLSLVAVGYPAESHPAADRFDAGRVHYDQW